MEIELNDIAGLPESLKGFISDKDGKQVLDLAKAAADLDGWKAKTQTARSESIDGRKELNAWKALGASPEDVQAKLAKGADPAIIDAMRTSHATELGALKQRITGVVTARAVADLKAELAKAGVVPEGLDLLASAARASIQIDDDGDIRVIGADGKPMIGQGANGGATLADLAGMLAKANPRLVEDKGQGGGGKQPGGQGGGRKVMTRREFDAMAQEDRAARMKDGYTVTD